MKKHLACFGYLNLTLSPRAVKAAFLFKWADKMAQIKILGCCKPERTVLVVLCSLTRTTYLGDS